MSEHAWTVGGTLCGAFLIVVSWLNDTLTAPLFIVTVALCLASWDASFLRSELRRERAKKVTVRLPDGRNFKIDRDSTIYIAGTVVPDEH